MALAGSVAALRPSADQTGATSWCDQFDRPNAAALGIRRVATQCCHDLFGTKDVQDAITATYVWMADQIGHLTLGFVPTVALNWILGLICPWLYEGGVWRRLIFVVPAVAVVGLWASKERTDLKDTSSRTTKVFPPDSGDVEWNVKTALLYFGMGAAFGLAPFLEYWLVPIVVVIAVWPGFAVAFWWLRRKLAFQQAALPYLFRLANFASNLEPDLVKAVTDLANVKNRRTNFFAVLVGKDPLPRTAPEIHHLLISGPLGAGKTSLCVGIGTEFAFALGKGRYLSATKLVESVIADVAPGDREYPRPPSSRRPPIPPGSDLPKISKSGLLQQNLLEGSVQRGGNRMRVNVQLVSTETGNQLWADRFDKPLADLFDMQDEIVTLLARALHTQLVAAEARRAERSPHPDSMDLFFQGRACLNSGLTPENMAQARDFFQRALSLDPDNLQALVGVANVDTMAGGAFYTLDRAELLKKAEAALTKALTLAPNHAAAHMFNGMVKMWTNRATEGIAECERALELDRNLADVHVAIAMGKIFIGRGGEAKAHVEQALRLSPRDPVAYLYRFTAGNGELYTGRLEEAVAWLRRSIETNRNFPLAHFYLAAALALLGRQEEAKASAASGFTFDPNFSIRGYRAGAATDNATYLAQRDRLIEGLRAAGVPEG